MIKNFLMPVARAFAFFLFSVAFAATISAWVVPALIPWIESAAGRALSYEVWMRMYLAVIAFLALWCFSVWVIARRRFEWSAALLVGWVFVAMLVFVFAADQKWTLTEENSWIRYPTAAGLFVAAVFLIIHAREIWKKAPRSADAFRLALLAVGLLFAGLDELFSIHEAVGAFLERSFSLPHTTTDLITAGYGIIGLGVLIFLAPLFLRPASGLSRRALRLFVFGMLVFMAATAFDTLDGVAFRAFRAFADTLAFRGYFFSDVWFLLYKPAEFLNSLEEVFETAAAWMFAFASATLVRDPRTVRLPSLRVFRPTTFALAAVILAFAFQTSVIQTNTPRSDGALAIKIASIGEGLFHSDDLDFSPSRGVVLANESEWTRRGMQSAPGVFTYNNGIFARVPDPEKKLNDIDSVAAHDRMLYASDGAEGKIFVSRDTAGWSALPHGKDFPSHPEGLAFDAVGRLAVLDESDRSVSLLREDGTVLSREIPKHPLFQKPEGIIYHPNLQTFLITDDTTGAIFRYEPGEPLSVFADSSDGLRFPEDIAVGPQGEIAVTDNGRRDLIFFDQKGHVLRRIGFRLLWRDLQGVTFDAEGNVYVVTADAFASASFVPSVLWMLPSSTLR